MNLMNFSVVNALSLPLSLFLLHRDGVKRVIAFSQYPQYSCSTTGSSLNKIAEIMAGSSDDIRWSFIDRWPTNDGLVQAFREQIERELAKFEQPNEVMLLFSAHSLPLSVS